MEEGRANAGLGVLGQPPLITHRFDDTTLNGVMHFQTAEHTHAFVTDLMSADLMASSVLPDTAAGDDTAELRTPLRASAVEQHASLQSMCSAGLKAFA